MTATARHGAAAGRSLLNRASVRRFARFWPWVLAALCLWVAWLIVREALAGQFEGDRPSYAVLVQPGDVAGLNAAADRLVAGSPRDAAVLARRSLAVRPLNPAAFRILGEVAAVQGNRPDAQRLFDSAARWSKRDGAAEVWLYDDQLRRRDFSAAVESADRLLRVFPDAAPSLYPSLIAIAGDRTARPALMARLAKAPPWRTAFLWALARDSRDPLVAADVMTGMADAGAAPTPEEIAPLLQRLVDARRYLEAFLAWRQFAPQTPAALASVRDGDFQGLQSAGPFVWALANGPGAAADISPSPVASSARDQSLHATYDGFSAPGAIASQLLVLAPGDYRFNVKANVSAPAADTRLVWTLSCADTGATLMTTNANAGLDTGWNTISGFATVPQAGCQGQWLRLSTAPGERPSRVEVWFDGVSMTRLRPAVTTSQNYSGDARTKAPDAELQDMSRNP